MVAQSTAHLVFGLSLEERQVLIHYLLGQGLQQAAMVMRRGQYKKHDMNFSRRITLLLQVSLFDTVTQHRIGRSSRRWWNQHRFWSGMVYLKPMSVFGDAR